MSVSFHSQRNPNGKNINKKCGATATQSVCEAVKAHHADIGIALDGDADRAIFVDHHGNSISGDAILGLAAMYLKDEGRLNHDVLVVTIMSNLALHKIMKEHGITVVETKVGDRNVIA